MMIAIILVALGRSLSPDDFRRLEMIPMISVASSRSLSLVMIPVGSLSQLLMIPVGSLSQLLMIPVAPCRSLSWCGLSHPRSRRCVWKVVGRLHAVACSSMMVLDCALFGGVVRCVVWAR
jgi:hypothetical protein